MVPSLAIVVSCHNFQRRFNLMLSSIVDQQNDKIPIIKVYVAHVKNNGYPTCEDLAEYYNKCYGLEFELLSFNDYSSLQYRGIVRTKQLKTIKEDWVLFADCDMVYTKSFFVCLRDFLSNYKDSNSIYSLGRFSCDRLACDNLVRNFQTIGKIENIGKICYSLPSIKKANVGAGYFQLVRKNTIDNVTGGIYVSEDENIDWSWDKKGQKAKSDRQFRKKFEEMVKLSTFDLMVGNEFIEKQKEKNKLKDYEKPMQFHLNHNRDNEFGFHLEEQR